MHPNISRKTGKTKLGILSKTNIPGVIQVYIATALRAFIYIQMSPLISFHTAAVVLISPKLLSDKNFILNLPIFVGNFFFSIWVLSFIINIISVLHFSIPKPLRFTTSAVKNIIEWSHTPLYM